MRPDLFLLLLPIPYCLAYRWACQWWVAEECDPGDECDCDTCR